MSRLPWVWASPPDDALRGLCRALDAGQLPPQRELIKENRLRSVWRLPGVAGGLLLKHYRRRDGETLKTLLLGGRAEREYRAMESLCRRGLPSARPVAFAEAWVAGRLQQSWFLSRLVRGARSLSEVLAELADEESVCLELAERAVRLVARMHRHPFLHRDLHAGNLLLDDVGRLVIIDMHSLWHVWRLTDRQRWDSLARLVYSLRETVSLDEAPRLARAYARERGDDEAQAVRCLAASLQRFAADYQRGRTARCLRTSSEFVSERLGLLRLHRRREYAAEQLSADLATHRGQVQAGEPLLGRARAATVSLIAGPEGSERVVKHYRQRGPWLALRGLLGRSRARGAWIAARRCEVHGVPTPRALALAEEPDGAAWLVTCALPRAVNLRTLATHLASGSALGGRGLLAWALGHVVGRLSRAGLRHADLSAKNVIIVGQATAGPTRDRRTCPPPGLPDVQLIDLDGLRLCPAHDEQALRRMLGQLADLPLAVSRTERLRFARGFAAAAGRPFPESLAREALAAARRRRLRRDGQQRRPLDQRPGAG